MVDKGAFLGRQHRKCKGYCFGLRSKSKTLYLQLPATKSRLDGCSSWFISQQSILSEVVAFLHCKGSCCSESIRPTHWVLQLGYLLTIHLDGGDAPPHMARLGCCLPLILHFNSYTSPMSACFERQRFQKNPDITDGLITKSSWPSSPCSITTSPHKNKNETRNIKCSAP